MEHKSCASCHGSFPIEDRDFKFYEKMQVPTPTLCPECRLQRRLSWRAERSLYFRRCDLSGKKILSVFPPNAKYKVFQIDEWYSDKWNALHYGREFDFNRPFFEQFSELMHEVPLLALNVVALQNCDYVNQVGYSKNCYLIVEADYDEDCLYSYRIFYSKTCVDCAEVFRCERCYQCVDCENCFNLKYSQLCKQSSESAFLYDCRGCMNCFGCVGLRNKNYHWFNEPLSPEEYGRRMKEFDFGNPEQFRDAVMRFSMLRQAHPRKAFIGELNENVSGNYIVQSKDCLDCFGVRESRDCRYGLMLRTAKDCYDYTVWGSNAEKMYETQTCGQNAQNLRFCSECWDGVHDLTYCFQCVLQTADCFGCVGVQRGRYCILNKQYSREEYEKLIPKIIEYMGGKPASAQRERDADARLGLGGSQPSKAELKNSEFGEFFPSAISPYSYNETAAQEYFPFEKDAALAAGLKWQDNLPFTTGKETVTWDRIPPEISQVSESITNEVLACEHTGRNFRITAQELKFYKEMKLPVPHLHPDERHRRRMMLRNPRKLFDRTCSTCGAAIQTTYAPDRQEKVVCEACYLKEVY